MRNANFGMRNKLIADFRFEIADLKKAIGGRQW